MLVPNIVTTFVKFEVAQRIGPMKSLFLNRGPKGDRFMRENRRRNQEEDVRKNKPIIGFWHSNTLQFFEKMKRVCDADKSIIERERERWEVASN